VASRNGDAPAVTGDNVDELIAAAKDRADAQRAEARRVARLKAQQQAGAPRHRYQPFGTAIEAFRFKGPELLYAGPAGTGKSKCLLEKLHAMMLKYPGARGLIVRKTLASLGSTALVTYEQHVAKEHLANGEVKWFGGSPKEAACYKYKNGSVIVVGGMDKSMKIMSSEYDVCYAQEATELLEEDWEAITTRLRNGKIPYQQIIADANPDVPTHWLKIRCDTGKTHHIQSRHEDNPILFHQNPDGTTGGMTEAGAKYMAKLDALTGVRYMRLRKGIWCAAEGLVYEEFDPNIHVHKAIRIPPISWTRYVTIDFGYTNPMVVQFWAEDEDGRLYLYRELYHTKTTVEDMAPQILAAMNLKKEPRPRMIICDHDAEGRAVLEKHLGMSTKAAKKTVEDGIQAVKSRLVPSEADGKPRLFLCRDALVTRDKELADRKKPTCTLEEIVGYVWDRGTTTAQAAGKPPKEVPVKEDDHGMDAMRYMIAERDLRSRPRVRTITY